MGKINTAITSPPNPNSMQSRVVSYRTTHDANTSKPSDLSSRIHTKYLLAEMATPIKNPPQELAYEGYVERTKELTPEASTDLLDIGADYESDIEAPGSKVPKPPYTT